MTPHTNDSKAGSWKEDVEAILSELHPHGEKCYCNDRDEAPIKDVIQVIVETNKKWLIGEDVEVEAEDTYPIKLIEGSKNQLRDEQRKAME